MTGARKGSLYHISNDRLDESKALYQHLSISTWAVSSCARTMQSFAREAALIGMTRGRPGGFGKQVAGFVVAVCYLEGGGKGSTRTTASLGHLLIRCCESCSCTSVARLKFQLPNLTPGYIPRARQVWVFFFSVERELRWTALVPDKSFPFISNGVVSGNSLSKHTVYQI
jgi:hypothetical protein